jgi:hypothetical protein
MDMLFISDTGLRPVTGAGNAPVAEADRSGGRQQLSDELGRLVCLPFRRLVQYMHRKEEISKASSMKPRRSSRTPIPGKQEIHDSAQTIRSILLTLATAIQRTEKAASDSSQTLSDVKGVMTACSCRPT